MQHFEIVHTEYRDIDFIYSMLKAAIEYQRKHNYPVWPLFERSAIEESIKQQRQYKMVINGQIACVFTCLLEDKVVWRSYDKKNAIYLHGVIINPKFKGQRLFGKVFEWAIQYARTRDLTYVRLDTWAENEQIIAYYKSFGFQFVEYYTTPDAPELPLQQRGNKVILLQYLIP